MLAKFSIITILFFSLLGHAQTKSNTMSIAEEIRYEELSNQLRCPTCQGLSVLDSTAPFSNQIKDIVKDQMALGKTDQEILDFFSTKYGFWILREPPREGFSLVAWLLPIFILAIGTLTLWMVYWRSSSQEDVVGNRSEENILEQFQKDLKAHRKSKNLLNNNGGQI